MTTRSIKLNQVNECFVNGDEHLGMRRLIDCVLDTDNLELFKNMIDVIEDHEKTEEANYNHQKINNLIETISNTSLILNKDKSKQNLLLEVKELAKQYRNSRFSISPVSFKVNYGDVVGLVGENGNGKTSLLRLLSKDLEPDSGHAYYAAEKTSLNLFELRAKLIYIPQRVPRWFGSLMDNLYFTLSSYAVTGEENSLRAELLIARLGLRPFKHLNWNRISSGYRTRFELAKSLLRKPELMLLDEPLSNLDIISQQTILQDLKYMSESLSHPFGLVLSSQQLYEVEKISDLVIFLKQGHPKYQFRNRNEAEMSKELIFELEADITRENLMKMFKASGITQLHFNGGVYVLHFKEGTEQKDIYGEISKNNIPINYIRNITYSSRRFFTQ